MFSFFILSKETGDAFVNIFVEIKMSFLCQLDLYWFKNLPLESIYAKYQERRVKTRNRDAALSEILIFAKPYENNLNGFQYVALLMIILLVFYPNLQDTYYDLR